MARRSDNTDGPIILWLDYGIEGWQPISYDNAKEALEDEPLWKQVLSNAHRSI